MNAIAIKKPSATMLDRQQVSAFVAATKDLLAGRSLSLFRDSAVREALYAAAASHFGAAIVDLVSGLQSPEKGISVLDIPELKNLGSVENAFWGCAVAVATAGNLMHPATDRRNGTPFSIYNASAENERRLGRAGLSFYKPEGKLGFHNDGRVGGERFFLPETVFLYNVHIGYRRPGCFHWVPFALWRDRERLEQRLGVGRRFKFRITPIIYPGQGDTLEVVGPQSAELPVFSRGPGGEALIFMNGEILRRSDTGADGDDDEAALSDLRDSFSRNPVRFSIDQRARRAIFIANRHGCHARDVFEEPLPGQRVTRSFLRAVDSEGFALN